MKCGLLIESVSLCLHPGCSSLKFDVLWQGYTSFDDTRFSILYSWYAAICQTCSLNKNWIFFYRKELVPFEKFKFKNIKRKWILILKQRNSKLMEKYSWKNLSRYELGKYFFGTRFVEIHVYFSLKFNFVWNHFSM